MNGLHSWLGRLTLSVFFLIAIGAVFSARVIMEGDAELVASDAAFDRGELGPALDHARRSATLYAPGAPHVQPAYERLNAIAVGAEAAGQPKVAFLAWQAMRSAALESRHVWLPRAQELERANQNLARLERGRARRGTKPCLEPPERGRRACSSLDCGAGRGLLAGAGRPRPVRVSRAGPRRQGLVPASSPGPAVVRYRRGLLDPGRVQGVG